MNPDKCEAAQSAEAPPSTPKEASQGMQWIERWIDHGTPWVQHAGSDGYPVSRSVASAETPNSHHHAVDEVQWIERWIDNGVQWTQPAGAARAHPSSSTSAVGDCVSRSLACAEQPNLQHNDDWQTYYLRARRDPVAGQVSPRKSRDKTSETSVLCDREVATIMGLPVDSISITTTIATHGSLSHPFEN